jgi:hypothetical protein
MAPSELRELRRILRYRSHIVGATVKMKNKISGLLMEVALNIVKVSSTAKNYFYDLPENIEDVPDSVIYMLQFSRSNL